MDRKFRISLSARLVLFSSLIAIIAVAVMGILFTFFLNRRFRDYLQEENAALRGDLVQNFSSYMASSGTMDPGWLEQFSNVYMEQGMFISVNSPEGEVMWSCMKDNNEMCMEHMENSHIDPLELQDLDSESYEVPLGDSGESTVLNISYVPGDSFSENDRFFLRETYRMLLLSIIITLFLSALMSLLLSKSISRPLADLTACATRLAGHDYGAFETEESSIRELYVLHQAVDNLARSLQSQEMLRKRLTADVSHELRTPLTSLQTTLEAMIDGIWPAERDRLESCRNEILRLSTLVKDLDDLHRYDKPVQNLEKEKIRLRKSLKSAINLFDKNLEQKGITIGLECPDIKIFGDGSRLKQVWINLLSNALKFTPEKGRIHIAVEEKDHVIVTFFNSGEGIDKDDLPHIFERFYKAESSRNTSGSGLGLAIVREIIELHGGTLMAHSDKGQGTRISLSLPG